MDLNNSNWIASHLAFHITENKLWIVWNIKLWNNEYKLGFSYLDTGKLASLAPWERKQRIEESDTWLQSNNNNTMTNMAITIKPEIYLIYRKKKLLWKRVA